MTFPYRVVFVHYYDPRYLKYACYQSLSQGYETLVIGDAAVEKVPYVDFLPVENFAEASSRFANIYQHVSVNDHNYELKCYLRWFMLREYMNTSGDARPIILLDSDILAYRQLGGLADLLNGRLMLDCAWMNFITSPKILDEFCDFLLRIYSDRSELSVLSVKYAVNGQPHLSDMHLLWEFADRRPDLVARIRHTCHRNGFDNSLSLTHDFVAYKGIKLIRMINGAPYGQLSSSGALLEFATLHFQGLSKPLMERFHTISDEKYLRQLDVLGPTWWQSLRDRTVPLAINVHEYYNALAGKDTGRTSS